METRWGKLLGRYEIVAELGRGAMGVVYKACDPKIDRFVAIKTISLNRTDPNQLREFRERFFVEAQAAGRLLHPGIVTVFDMGEEPDTQDPFIVMEYIEGQNLRDLVAKEGKTLALGRALQLTQEIAEALDYAHAQGVVHRDIKPANILVTKEGQAKVTDFGIAQLDLSHTSSPGRPIGTPAYMSPEQLEGGRVDGRSDLFSLGAILYSLVTGFSPFQGSSATTVCFKVANRDPLDATTLVAELPPELDSIIARALAKDPAERYQRGMEFALDLRELQERFGRPLQPTKRALWSSTAEAGRASVAESGRPRGSFARSAQAGFAQSASARLRNPLFLLRSFSTSTLIGAVALLLFAAVVVSSIVRHTRSTPQLQATNASASSNHDLPPSPAPTPGAAGPSSVAASPTQSSSPAPAAPAASHRAAVAKSAAPSHARMNSPIADSNVQIDIEDRFSDATLSLWIDNNLQYEHPLRDGRKNHVTLFGRAAKETVTIPVAAGKHELRIRVRSGADQYEQSKSVTGDFLKGGEKILAINFEKRTKEMHLTLR